jgi:hypothetical protein
MPDGARVRNWRWLDACASVAGMENEAQFSSVLISSQTMPFRSSKAISILFCPISSSPILAD